MEQDDAAAFSRPLLSSRREQNLGIENAAGYGHHGTLGLEKLDEAAQAQAPGELVDQVNPFSFGYALRATDQETAGQVADREPGSENRES
jgi:hypothetical protein